MPFLCRTLELLDRGYAPRLILDVTADAKIYQWTQPELAEKYVQGLPKGKSITICVIHGLSTEEEASKAGRCLESIGGTHVLLVTSDYHTRRALSIFSREAPNHTYSVAAAYDPLEPNYPLLARQTKIQGAAVVLQVLIGRDGTIQHLHVLSGPMIFSAAAREAVPALP